MTEHTKGVYSDKIAPYIKEFAGKGFKMINVDGSWYMGNGEINYTFYWHDIVSSDDIEFICDAVNSYSPRKAKEHAEMYDTLLRMRSLLQVLIDIEIESDVVPAELKYIEALINRIDKE